MKELLNNDTFVFYGLLTICFVIIYIPVIGKYFRVLETMIHEGGHVLMALFTRTKIKKINLFSNTSGETHIVPSSTLKTILIGLVGYPFSSAAAWFSFWAIDNTYHRWFVIVLCGIIFLFLLAYIRNGFGIFWAITFLASNGYLLYAGEAAILNILAAIYADILFISSLASCFVIVYLSFKFPNKAGDATLINKATHIPTQIVGIILFLISLLIAFITITDFFPFFKDLNIHLFNLV